MLPAPPSEPDPSDRDGLPLVPLTSASSSEPSPSPPNRFPDPPADFRPDARAAFRQMARDCGFTIFRMPGSCEMYLRQYLADYEPERQALIDGLRREVPHKIAQFTEPDGYEDYLLELSENYAIAADVSREVAWWVVTGWATAQGKPLRQQLVATPASASAATLASASSHLLPVQLRLAMCGIAAGGGFLGGLTGLAIPLLILFGADVWSASSENAESNRATLAAVGSLFIILFCALGSLGAALGAGFGWHMGRGNQYPWAGFGAAFVSTATTAATFGFCCGPLNPVTVVVLGLVAFGAAYTAASRGGYSV